MANFPPVEAPGVIFEEILLVRDSEPHAGPWNMAMDEVLLQEARGPLLRCYCWAEPAVSFGYFGRYDEAQGLWPERPLVRRWTGGGIVPHGADFTYTLVVPGAEPHARQPAADSYRLIHAAVAEALGDTGGLSLAEGSPKISNECFANPAPHDVLADGVKIAGAAQRRTRKGLLHQGSIQRAGLNVGFNERLARSLARSIAVRSISSGEQERAMRLAADRYGTAEWLTRR